MALTREDFPEMTDEQWESIEAENDRARTQASNTATKNAEKDAKKAQDTAIKAAEAAARADERKRIEMDEAERIAEDRKKATQELEEQKAEVAAERKSLTATKKLAAAGLTEERITELLPMFVTVNDADLSGVLDSFVKTYQETVKDSVDAEKQTLLDNATPPAGPTDGPVDASAAATKFLSEGEDAAAVDTLLTEAGYVEQT